MTSILSLSDISVQQLHQPAEQLKLLQAARDVGFIRLTDFPEPERFDQVFQLAQTFFALSAEHKASVATRAYEAENDNVYRGYFPPLDNANALKEGFEIGPPGAHDVEHPLYERNRYPSALSDDWRRALEAYYEQMQALGLTILTAFEQSLDLPSGRLRDRFQHGVSTLRLIHYPQGSDSHRQTLERDQGEAFSTPAHVDSGILTLLLQDNTGGLQAKSSQGDWLDIEPIPGTLVMNLGALLETLTKGAVKATEHRVKMPPCSRYSIPFFMEPAAQAPVTDVFDLQNALGVEDYQAYLVRQMADFVEYDALVKRLSAG